MEDDEVLFLPVVLVVPVEVAFCCCFCSSSILFARINPKSGTLPPEVRVRNSLNKKTTSAEVKLVDDDDDEDDDAEVETFVAVDVARIEEVADFVLVEIAFDDEDDDDEIGKNFLKSLFPKKNSRSNALLITTSPLGSTKMIA